MLHRFTPERWTTFGRPSPNNRSYGSIPEDNLTSMLNTGDISLAGSQVSRWILVDFPRDFYLRKRRWRVTGNWFGLGSKIELLGWFWMILLRVPWTTRVLRCLGLRIPSAEDSLWPNCIVGGGASENHRTLRYLSPSYTVIRDTWKLHRMGEIWCSHVTGFTTSWQQPRLTKNFTQKLAKTRHKSFEANNFTFWGSSFRGFQYHQPKLFAKLPGIGNIDQSAGGVGYEVFVSPQQCLRCTTLGKHDIWALSKKVKIDQHDIWVPLACFFLFF